MWDSEEIIEGRVVTTTKSRRQNRDIEIKSLTGIQYESADARDCGKDARSCCEINFGTGSMIH